MKKSISWIVIFISVFVWGILGCIVTVVTIDPFFQYHKPLEKFPYIVDNQLSQNPGMAKHFDYDSVIIGSSMTLNFDTDWFDEDFSCRTIKLPYNGAYPKDIRNIMDIVDESGHELKNVFLCIDEMSYSGEVDEIKYPLPTYLYDNDILNDISYWLNKDVLLNYVLKPVMDASQKTDLSDVYSTWKYFGYGKWVVFQSYMSPEKTNQYYPKDYYLEKVEANLETNILPILDTHPDTDFYIFFPPYSILYWYNYYKTDQIDAIISKYELIMKELLTYKNVKLYMFSVDEEIITNLENYSDYEHFSREVSYDIEKKMLEKQNLVTMEGLPETIKKMKKFVENYDYDGIWEGWEDYLYEK